MKKLILLLCLPLIVAGCTVIKVNKGASNTTVAPSTGFYKTIDRGDNWSIKSSILAVNGDRKSFSGANVTVMAMDPTDAKTLYLGTADRGLLISHDRGEGWQETLTGLGVINGVAVDPQSRCTIYALVYNKVYKTVDCAREWKPIQLSSLEGEYYSALAIDFQNPRIVYVGTSKGTILRSTDSGFSWQAISYQPSRISWMIVNPAKAKEFYLATVSSGLRLSNDNGVTWKNLGDLEVEGTAANGKPNKALKDLAGSQNYLYAAYDPSGTSQLLYSNNYGMFRLTKGNIWQEIQILNKPKQERVLAIAINQTNGQELFFVTDGAFYQTKNGGTDWTVRKLPTPGTPRFLLANPTNANELYVTFFKTK